MTPGQIAIAVQRLLMVLPLDQMHIRRALRLAAQEAYNKAPTRDRPFLDYIIEERAIFRPPNIHQAQSVLNSLRGAGAINEEVFSLARRALTVPQHERAITT